MKKYKAAAVNTAELRRRAEEKQKATAAKAHPPIAEPDAMRLVHELQVHQIELELQNEELRKARDEAAVLLESYSDLYEFAPVGYFTLDCYGHIRQVNMTGASLVGTERSQLMNMRFALVVSPESRPIFNKFLERAYECQQKESCEVVLQTNAGGPIDVQLNATVAGEGEECRVAMVDITDRKRAVEALIDSERRYRSLWESASEGFCLHELIIGEGGVAVNYRILDVNPAYEDMFDLKASDVVGKLATEAFHTTEPPYLKEYTRVALTGVSDRFETFSERCGKHFSISAFSPSPGQFATAFVDISERKTHDAVLTNQAIHDALTGLPNRQYFEQRLGELIANCAGKKSCSMAVLFLDLDKFKLVNDTLGHEVGDLLLIEVARRLQLDLRSEDLLARMGGDEFIVILPRCRNREIADSVASRIIDSISRPYEIQNHRFVSGASIGLASYPSDGTDTITLLKHADAAMYKAKQAGRGTFRWFTGDVDVDNQQRADMETDIRAALEKGQFNVYYQPIVSLEHGNILAAEALLRWEHPEKGMISPSLFIPIAEEMGLIGKIGNYVLRTACTQAVAWSDAGIHLSQIGVNVSTRQVRDAKWLHSVQAAIADTGIDPKCLNLELTETGFAADIQSMRKTLRKVHELGICMAIDDFGTGHSSLSRLKDFPVINLKIDGSFVRDIEHDKSSNALVRSITEMAHSQGINVTAEWVETESQMEILRSIGCDYAQGYYISPALSAEAFGDFIRSWTSPVHRWPEHKALAHK